MKLEDLKIYLVRNSDGQYYRRVGYGGYGSCWTNDIARASVWTKLSTARARVTWFANHYPTFPAPSLIEIAAGKITVHDESERVEKAKQALARAEARRKERWKAYEYERAKVALEEARRQVQIAEAKINAHTKGKDG